MHLCCLNLYANRLVALRSRKREWHCYPRWSLVDIILCNRMIAVPITVRGKKRWQKEKQKIKKSWTLPKSKIRMIISSSSWLMRFCMSLYWFGENECKYCLMGTEKWDARTSWYVMLSIFAVLPHGHIASPPESGAKPIDILMTYTVRIMSVKRKYSFWFMQTKKQKKTYETNRKISHPCQPKWTELRWTFTFSHSRGTMWKWNEKQNWVSNSPVECCFDRAEL